MSNVTSQKNREGVLHVAPVAYLIGILWIMLWVTCDHQTLSLAMVIYSNSYSLMWPEAFSVHLSPVLSKCCQTVLTSYFEN